MVKELEDKKGRNSKIYFIIVLIVLLLAVIAAAVCLWQTRQGWGGTISFHRPSTTPTPSQTPDEYAGWKEFINSDYGYTIKYPPSAKLSFPSNEEAQKAGLKSGKACVTIKTEYGHVIIAAREFFDIAFSQSDVFFDCLRTGIGNDYQQTEGKIIVENTEYPTMGAYTITGADGGPEEFYSLTLDDGIKMEYGLSKINKNADTAKYQGAMDEVAKIVKSYHRTADYSYDTYYSTQAKLTFQFPKGWIVREDYFYKDSTFRTIILCSKKEPQDQDVFVNCVQINMPQAPIGTKHAEIKGNWINIYTDNSMVVKAFDKIVETFKVID